MKKIKSHPLQDSPGRFLNREISWLAFNRRVLEEANNLAHPLFERVRFVSICASNLDEFFMVRVAGLKGQVKAGVNELSTDGMTPAEQLDAIQDSVEDLTRDLQNTWHDLMVELAEHGIHIRSTTDITEEQRAALTKSFRDEIMPVLTPIAMDPAHPFPFIPNLGLALMVQIEYGDEGHGRNILIQIPNMLGRFVGLEGEGQQYIQIEKVIMMHIREIFPECKNVKGYATFRVIRDSDFEIEEGAEDLTLIFESALKRRRRGNVIHLSVHHNVDKNILGFLQDELGIMDHQVMKVNGLVGLSSCAALIDDTRKDLLFPPYDARFPERIRDFSGDCFAAIRHKDIIVHHPYESFDVVVQFLKQAAADPDVISIKQTLYRTSDNSPIVKALIEAAEEGKTVTALVELKARFDEEANIKWARDMERAGVQVVYGFLDLKTHAKVSFVVRREGGKLRSYAHLGTGNYHPQNAKIYTDLSYFTCDPQICRDTGILFNYMTGYAVPQNLEKLAISPFNLRETIAELIDNEIANKMDGKPAAIWMKCNALLDGKIIDKLYKASQAGVQVDLIVRGICTLRPGIKGLSENIRVKSIVGRYLEHARIYAFGNGAALPSREARVFISSADMMERNLSRRIEALVPIENETVHAQVLDQIMMANLKDQKQSWIMDKDGHYKRMKAEGGAFSAQDYFMTNPSLSGRGRALEIAPMPPRLQFDEKNSENHE